MKTHDQMGPLWNVHFPFLRFTVGINSKSFPWIADSVHGTTSIETVDEAGVLHTWYRTTNNSFAWRRHL